MAITITAGAWASGSTAPAPALPASPQAGDVHVLFIGCKPYSATINTPNGWTPITDTNGTNGTTANGTDVGSVHVAAFYRIWQSGDSNPTISITSGNTALACIHRLRPTAGSTIQTPVGHRGSDTSSGTGFSCTMGADIGITAGDAIVSYSYIAGNNATFGTPTLAATGVTFGTVTENPATEGSTTTGYDCEASASTALPSAGPSSAAAVVGWTLSVAQTGMANLIRIREIANHALTATGIATGAPALGNPAIAQLHALLSTGIATGAPVLGTPTCAGPVNELQANGITIGAPVVNASTLAQVHALVATLISMGAPVVGVPTIGQLHALAAAGIGIGAPVLGTPTLQQICALVALGVSTGPPVLGQPTMAQLHALLSQGISAGAPVIDSPTLGFEEEGTIGMSNFTRNRMFIFDDKKGR